MIVAARRKTLRADEPVRMGTSYARIVFGLALALWASAATLNIARYVRNLSGDSRRRRKCVNKQVSFLSPHFVVRGVRKGGQRRLNEINNFQRQVRNVRVRDGGVQNG